MRTAIVILGSCLLAAPLACEVQAATFCDDASEPCRGQGLVVDVAWLQAALDAGDDVQVIDVRDPQAFAAGHIPGALTLDVAALDGVPGQLARREQVERAFQAAGLRTGARVVVLADVVAPASARVVWALHYFGHPAAHLLQGGWQAWVDAGADLEIGPSQAPPGDIELDETFDELRVDAAWVLARLGDPTVVLVDVRAPAEYAAVHIPGALNIDWRGNLRRGFLRALDELAALYVEVPRTHTVVTYSTGTRSALTYLVLRALGYPDVRVYDGSWSEWGARDDLPKER